MEKSWIICRPVYSFLNLINGFVPSLQADILYYYSSNSGLFKRLNCIPGEAQRKMRIMLVFGWDFTYVVIVVKQYTVYSLSRELVRHLLCWQAGLQEYSAAEPHEHLPRSKRRQSERSSGAKCSRAMSDVQVCISAYTLPTGRRQHKQRKD